jgi:NAD(P)-dependent dehydrogenase (short-subunit alcohol dehydrogenase family)
MIVPFGWIYTASKWALEALAETSSYELAPFGIDVAIVEPGAFATDIFSKTAGADDAACIASYGDVARVAAGQAARVEAGSVGRDPNDVARAILQLANAPAGTRPLRTVVPNHPAVDAINAALAPIQAKIIEAMSAPAATQPR